MAKSTVVRFTLVSCVLALVACGQEAPNGGHSSEASANVDVSSAWNGADACSVLDKAAAAAILKQELSGTQLGLVHEADGSTAATSECTYLGADGASVARLMTRWSPISDNTPAAIAGARSTTAATMKAFSSAPLEDIPSLGKAAFFVPKINQLNVFIDDARMIIVSVEKVPVGASGKDIAVTMARKAGA